MLKALIPVRAGSVRVKNKNIRPFADSTLLEIKIRQLQRISQLDGIIVNSDCETMLGVAESMGVEIVKRKATYASSEISANEFYYNVASTFDADTVLLANVTSPLISDKTIQLCIDTYLKNTNKHDSCNTVNAVKMFLWHNGVPINYSLSDKPKSQDLPDIVAINSAINIISKENMLLAKEVIGKKPLFVTVSDLEGLDIDNELDFEIAELLYKKHLL